MEISGAVILLVGDVDDVFADTAAAFDRAGARVALAAPGEHVERLAARLPKALLVPTEPSEVDQARAAVERTVERFGRLDVLINRPSPAPALASDGLTGAAVRSAMDAGFIAPMALTQAAVRQMRRQGRGHVINCSSPAFLVGYPMAAPHSAAAAAFSSWTRVMQAEWYGSNIAVTEFFAAAAAPSAESAGVGSGLVAWMVRPERSYDVATRLVQCARKKRPFAYAGLGVRLLCLAGVWTRVRLGIGATLAATVRSGSGLPIFSSRAPDEVTAVAPLRAPVAVVAAAVPPESIAIGEDGAFAAPPAVIKPAAPAAVEPAAPAAMEPAAPVAPTAKRRRVAKSAQPAKRAKPKPASAAAPPAPSVPAPVAAGEPAPSKTAAGEPALSKPAAAEPAPGKPARRRGGAKVQVLSPEATARVRAAAERAAAAAKAETPRRRRRPAGGGSSAPDGDSSADS